MKGPLQLVVESSSAICFVVVPTYSRLAQRNVIGCVFYTKKCNQEVIFNFLDNFLDTSTVQGK